MLLVFAFGSGGDTLFAAFGYWGGALHTMVLVGHQRMPSSSTDVPVPDSCRVTQPGRAGQEEWAPSGHRFGCSEWDPSNAGSNPTHWCGLTWRPRDGHRVPRQGREVGCLRLAHCNGWALPQVHTEPGKTSGFCKRARHRAKLLNVPHQGDVEVECGVALVQPGVML